MPGEGVGLLAEHYIHESVQPKQHAVRQSSETTDAAIFYLVVDGCRRKEIGNFLNSSISSLQLRCFAAEGRIRPGHPCRRDRSSASPSETSFTLIEPP